MVVNKLLSFLTTSHVLVCFLTSVLIFHFFLSCQMLDVRVIHVFLFCLVISAVSFCCLELIKS